MATQYSSTINIGISIPDGIKNSEVPNDIYGLLIPRKERKVIAAIGIESRKSPGLVPQGELLNVMLDGHTGKRLSSSSEEAVLEEVLPELEMYFPNVSKRIAFTHSCRWQEAMPYSPIGRSHAIHAYRQSCLSKQKVILAGDYLSTPTTEGAAQSGLWASRQFLRK